jgi:hypothetical protein
VGRGSDEVWDNTPCVKPGELVAGVSKRGSFGHKKLQNAPRILCCEGTVLGTLRGQEAKKYVDLSGVSGYSMSFYGRSEFLSALIYLGAASPNQEN